MDLRPFSGVVASFDDLQTNLPRRCARKRSGAAHRGLRGMSFAALTAFVRRLAQDLRWPLSGLAVLLVPIVPALAAGKEKGPSEAVFVAGLLCLMVVGRLLGELMLRLRQPAVMGQLIAGLILGPSLFGLLLPD